MEEIKTEAQVGEKSDTSEASKKIKQNHSNNLLIVLAVLLIVFCGLAGAAGLGLMRHTWRNNVTDNISRETMHYQGDSRGCGTMNCQRSGANRDGRMMRGSSNGTIAKIDGDNLTVTISGKEQAVVISEDTAIYDNNGSIISKNDLKVGDEITVAGRPNSSGQIKAHEITQK